MVDCLQNDSIPAGVVFNEDGTVKLGYGCLSAAIQRCMLSDHVEYDIQLKHPKGYTWCVTRRYREFRVLQKVLQSKYDLAQDQVATLPGKKFFNNLSPAFVQQRSLELEEYLNRLLSYYTLPPPPLASFIDWERYDVHGITNSLARQLSKDGEKILSSGEVFVMNVYQVSAINQRMKSPVSENLFNRADEDFGCVVKFIAQIKRLKLNNVDLASMRGFEHIKATVIQLVVHHSLKNLKNLMLGDLFAAGGGNWVYGENPVPTLPWDQIKIADFSNNFLHIIDQTIALLPNVEILNLSNNLLTELAPLSSLSRLRVLYLSDNQLYIGEETNPCSVEVCEDEADVLEGLVLASSAGTIDSATEQPRSRQTPLKSLRERLGEVQVLVLAKNGLRSANLVEGLFSLQHLDLSDNKIDSFEELVCLGELPHLNSLELTGNPICDHAYYRRNALNVLGPRFPLIVLDGKRVTAKECENVRLYQALMKGGVVSQPAALDNLKSAAPPVLSTSSSNLILNQQNCVNIPIQASDTTEPNHTPVHENKIELPSEGTMDFVSSKDFKSSSPRVNVPVDGIDYFRNVSDEAVTDSLSKPSEIGLNSQRTDISHHNTQASESLHSESFQKTDISAAENFHVHHERNPSSVSVEEHTEACESQSATHQDYSSTKQPCMEQIEECTQITKEINRNLDGEELDPSGIHQMSSDVMFESLQSKAVDISDNTYEEDPSLLYQSTLAESKDITGDLTNVIGSHHDTQVDFPTEQFNDNKSLSQSGSAIYAEKCARSVSNLDSTLSSSTHETELKMSPNEPQVSVIENQQLDSSTGKSSKEPNIELPPSLAKQSEPDNVMEDASDPDLVNSNSVCYNILDPKNEHSSVEKQEEKESEVLQSIERSSVDARDQTADISNGDPESAPSSLHRSPPPGRLVSVTEFTVSDDPSMSFPDSRKSSGEKLDSNLDSFQKPEGDTSSSSQ
ncbi:unnamed protein product [Hydatigera taeniaeformis]|uniref:PX domain-containing protein n=1 Tax=Hydatigena taeniaeformis TaxID=6205 RepID=A0A158RE11_HYDTA|nr:unnamed protein product [Hydatigera taeniaeformis]